MVNVIFELQPKKPTTFIFHLDVKLSNLPNGTICSYRPNHEPPPWTEVGGNILNSVSQVAGVGMPYYDGYSFRFQRALAFNPVAIVQQILAVIHRETGEHVTLFCRLSPNAELRRFENTPSGIEAGLRQLTN